MQTRVVNDRQRAVLKWIGEGCPAGRWKDSSYKTSAQALQNRGLVEVSRRRGVWSAVLTPRGQHFLASGSYPSEPEPPAGHEADRSRGSAASRPIKRTQRDTPKPRAARDTSIGATLVAEVTAAGGSLTVPTREAEQYEAKAGLAIRTGHLPAGKVLRVERNPDRALTLTLADAPVWMTPPDAVVDLPPTLRGPHAAVVALRTRREVLPRAEAPRRRALLIAQAVAREGEARGWAVEAPAPRAAAREASTRRHPWLSVRLRGHTFTLALQELTDRVPHRPTKRELAAAGPWARPIATHDSVPNGRLCLWLLDGPVVGQSQWRATTDPDLPATLGAVLREIELRADALDQARERGEREAAAARKAWQAALVRARKAAIEAHRAEVLADQVDRWHRHRLLTAYVADLRATVGFIDPGQRNAAEQWLEWAERHLRETDPLAGPIQMPVPPDLTAQALAPFMDGWSPYGPQASGSWGRGAG